LESPDEKYQYIIFAADPYENIAFKIPNLEIDNSEEKYYCNWDKERKIYTIHVYFRERKIKNVGANKLPSKPVSFNPIGVKF
jgi:splicing factor 3A subunit 2